MQRSGFVLAGGRSLRMGRDKALLLYPGTTLVEHIAGAVLAAAGSVSIVGDPARYGFLGYPVHPDQLPGCGPLGGLYTALNVSTTDWNLVVACDMPGISSATLRSLFDRALQAGNCAVATGPEGKPEPLL